MRVSISHSWNMTLQTQGGILNVLALDFIWFSLEQWIYVEVLIV